MAAALATHNQGGQTISARRVQDSDCSEADHELQIAKASSVNQKYMTVTSPGKAGNTQNNDPGAILRE